MRVFTHYYPVSDKEGFSWRTLLQFGESWEVIGSVVLGYSFLHLNSEKTVVSIPRFQVHLSNFDTVDSMEDEWYQYEPNHVMEAISKMFAMRCEYKGVPLKGIVQIYFLRDIWDAIYYNKEDRDYRKFKIQEKILQYDIESLRPPIYIGFMPVPIVAIGSYYKNVEAFFNRAIELGTKYLNKRCGSNEFLNPTSLLYCVEKNDPKAVAVLEQFIRE